MCIMLCKVHRTNGCVQKEIEITIALEKKFMSHTPGELNPSASLAEPLAWVSHDQHACCPMGHFTGINFSTENNLQSSNSKLGKGVSGTDVLNSHNPNMETCRLLGSLKAQFKMSAMTLSPFLVHHLSNSPDSLS